MEQDPEAHQLALIREQRPIVEALRGVGLAIDFLFSPPAGALPPGARAILLSYLGRPLSVETLGFINALLDCPDAVVDEPPSKERG